MILSRLFSGASLITIIRYVLQALGGVLVANGKFDAGQWETLSGAVLVIVPLFLGVKASITPKVVTPKGDTIPLDKMTVTEKKDVVATAVTAKARKPGLLDRLLNRT